MAQNGASQECDKPSREIGPIAYFYHWNCADLTSSLPNQNHARSLEEPSQNILLHPLHSHAFYPVGCRSFFACWCL
jgi:hypothetical protein